MKVYNIGIVGIGKITQDQHLPVIAANDRFHLAGLVSQRGVRREGAPTFRTAAELYAAAPDLDAVSICTPPNVRYAFARQALDAGKHVLLEKPPAPTVAEMIDLAAYAAARGRVIFATWHSQYNLAVEEARKFLAGQRISELAIEWRENVRRWHPGQEWIWEAGNFGVFDPGINALSILTAIFPAPIFIKSADLTFPENRDAPIAAALKFTSPAAESDETPMFAHIDWRQANEDCWNIDIVTAAGDRLRLADGGQKLWINGERIADAPPAEYQAIYRRFANLLDAGQSSMEAAPFQLVADAFLVGRRSMTEPFHW